VRNDYNSIYEIEHFRSFLNDEKLAPSSSTIDQVSTIHCHVILVCHTKEESTSALEINHVFIYK